MTAQPYPTTLFPPDTTLPPTCKSCRATRKDQCNWASDREYRAVDYPQPRTCLLRHDPAKGEIPY